MEPTLIGKYTSGPWGGVSWGEGEQAVIRIKKIHTVRGRLDKNLQAMGLIKVIQ
jgi:hypothetical protein